MKVENIQRASELNQELKSIDHAIELIGEIGHVIIVTVGGYEYSSRFIKYCPPELNTVVKAILLDAAGKQRKELVDEIESL